MILFLLFLKFCLVYFHIYLKIFQTTFFTVLKLCVNLNFLKIGFLKKGATFKKMHPTCILLKASILNLGIILSCVVDTVATPYCPRDFVILCDDTIIIIVHIDDFMLLAFDMFVIEIPLICLSFLPGRIRGKPLSWVDTSLSLVETIMIGGAWGGMMSGGSV